MLPGVLWVINLICARGEDLRVTMDSLLVEVSHDEVKMRERRETSAGFPRVSYHACAGVSLTTSDSNQ